MPTPPSPAASNGRSPGGRFGPGNACGRGNPHARRVTRLRAELLRAVTPQDLHDVVVALLEKAKAGEIAAARELLQRLLGPPVELDLLQRLEALEGRLTAEQVKQYGLPPVMTAKETSVHHAKFTARHGQNVFELEALPPAELQKVVRDAIDRTINVAAFNAELEAEKRDAAFLAGVRKTVVATLAGMDFGGGTQS